MSIDPFSDPPESLSHGRRFRGRLAAPVTVWTAGPADGRAGLTVSSLVVADGEPALVLGLINDTTDLFEAVMSSEAFIVHVVEEHQHVYSERFAGLRPSPGGLFAGLDVADGPHGPVLRDLPVRAYCRLDGVSPAGFHQVVAGRIEGLDLGEPGLPLIRFRGRYRGLNR